MNPRPALPLIQIKPLVLKVHILRGALREAVDAFYGALEQYTLQDLAIHPPKLIALLDRRLHG